MPTTLPNGARTKEVQRLDQPRPKAAHAHLKSPSESTADLKSPSGSKSFDDLRLQRLGKAVKRACVLAHGSGMAWAIEVGVDQSQLNRQCERGTLDLRGMASAGETALAQLGRELQQEFGGAMKSKKQIAREVLPQMMQTILDLTDE